MKAPFVSFLLLLTYSSPCLAKEQIVVGEDDAGQGAYGEGWGNGKNGGSGFGPWTLRTATEGGDQSHAGFFIATKANNADLNGIATHDKAWGLFANGSGFEQAVAFRAFDRPLRVGQTFSFLFEHGAITPKFAVGDSAPGSVGLVLRGGDSATAAMDRPEDYNAEARWEFGFYKAEGAYQVFDADGPKLLEVPFTDAGISVTITLITADTYDLEVVTLSPKKIYRLTGRNLGGKPGAPIRSLAVFDRNGEANDLFVNGFQITQDAD